MPHHVHRRSSRKCDREENEKYRRDDPHDRARLDESRPLFRVRLGEMRFALPQVLEDHVAVDDREWNKEWHDHERRNGAGAASTSVTGIRMTISATRYTNSRRSDLPNTAHQYPLT